MPVKYWEQPEGGAVSPEILTTTDYSFTFEAARHWHPVHEYLFACDNKVEGKKTNSGF